MGLRERVEGWGGWYLGSTFSCCARKSRRMCILYHKTVQAGLLGFPLQTYLGPGSFYSCHSTIPWCFPWPRGPRSPPPSPHLHTGQFPGGGWHTSNFQGLLTLDTHELLSAISVSPCVFELI